MPLFPLFAWPLPLAAALDMLLGDPRGWPHPVRAIGALIARLEVVARRVVRATGGGVFAERLAGAGLTTLTVGATALTAWSVVLLCDRLGPVASVVGQAILIYWGLAIRSLGDETLRASEAEDLATARRELAMIVGRDTGALDEPEIGRACIETVSENFADAVVAPLFWFVVGGPVGLWAFKAVSTLDSMVGYRNDRYRHLGWASARLDDLAAYVPARAAWLLIGLAAWFARERPWNALRVGWRDGRNHPSPNSGWGEAAMAGALSIRLGGPATYGGIPSFKPWLGEPEQTIERGTVRRSIRVMRIAAALAVALAWGLRCGLLSLG